MAVDVTVDTVSATPPNTAASSLRTELRFGGTNGMPAGQEPAGRGTVW